MRKWSKLDRELYNSACRLPYSIVWRKLPDSDGGGFIAYYLEFGECACSFADSTLRKAIRGLPAVKRFVLEVMTDNDSQYPEPLYDKKAIIDERYWNDACNHVYDCLVDVNAGRAEVNLVDVENTLHKYHIKNRWRAAECFITVFEDC